MFISWTGVALLTAVSVPFFTFKRTSFAVIKCLTFILDILLLPIHYVLQMPDTTQQRAKRIRAQRANPDLSDSPFVRVGDGVAYDENLLACDSLDSWFRYIVSKYGSQPCFGTREKFAEIEERQANGKIARKFVLDNTFKFSTYLEVEQKVQSLMREFLGCGIKPHDLVPIFAETREEWMLSALALCRINAITVTIYANLGQDGIKTILNQTEATHMITTEENVPKLIGMAESIPKLKTVIYMHCGCRKSTLEASDHFELIPFTKFLSGQSLSPQAVKAPASDDLAVIMYTSGSTGVPKGVQITHGNIMASMRALIRSCLGGYKQSDQEVYLAYLPLAHIFELGAEIIMMSFGIPVAYSGVMTMSNNSMGIRKGTPSDMTLVRPTIMSAVPLILERMKRGIEEKLNEKRVVGELFKMAYEYKKFWAKRGFRTYLIDQIFSQLKRPFGGRLRLMLVGGAPLAVETQEFASIGLCINVLQGYAATEATACTALMDMEDQSYGRVGAPLFGVNIKLLDWPEGGYSNQDKPHARGELIIGGPAITMGYYKNPEETDQVYEEKDGTRWWRSGDIGEVFEDGTIKIIDRKKDLVKLQHGEYISLGKVEAALKNCSYVDNICVHGDSMHKYCVALVLPEKVSLAKLVNLLGKAHLSLEEQCMDKEIETHILKSLTEYGLSRGLLRYEIPSKIKLCAEEWTPNNELVTAALKIRRHQIKQFYKTSIDKLYSS